MLEAIALYQKLPTLVRIREFLSQIARFNQSKCYYSVLNILGDTRFTIYTSPAHPQLLHVKLLISEATYLDVEKSAGMAEKWGHICIGDFARNSSLFEVT